MMVSVSLFSCFAFSSFFVLVFFSCASSLVRVFIVFVLSIGLLMYICFFQCVLVFSGAGTFDIVALAGIGLKASLIQI